MKSKTKWAIPLALLAVVMLAGTALAAWLLLATGSTTSTETTGSATTSPVTVTVANRTDALVAGGPAATLPVQINNNGSGATRIDGVTLAVTTTSAGSACPPSAFTVTQPTTFSTTTGSHTVPFSVRSSGHANSTAKLAVKATAPTTCEDVTVNLKTVVT